jgi:hypothetical protein
MDDEVRDVEVQLKDDRIVPAKLIIREAAPEHPELVQLSLEFRAKQITRNAEDLFEAMCSIRKVLEEEGALLRCYGASRNVYPSGMTRDMGSGRKAYKLRMGAPAKLEDLVSILDTGPDVTPVTVEEQEKFFNAWIKSLK